MLGTVLGTGVAAGGKNTKTPAPRSLHSRGSEQTNQYVKYLVRWIGIKLYGDIKQEMDAGGPMRGEGVREGLRGGGI